MQNHTIKQAVLAAAIGVTFQLQAPARAAELNTQLPGEQEEGFQIPVTLDMPAQPLAAALRQFAIETSLSLTVDSALIVDKKSPAVKGRMARKEALKRLLDGTGLQGKIDGEKIVIQRAIKAETKSVDVDKVEVRAKRFYEVGPLPGLGLTKEEIPGNVQSISAKEIKEAHSLSITDLMNRKLQSVTVNDYQGNPFQMDVQYRGFSAGPQIGTPQGLSVFLDGIRVNEPFGDVVNWDMLPMNALASVDVFPGSNPIFGLNTLGGAFSMKTKDGFNNAGADADILTGSFGRKQLQLEGGWNNGTIGLFAAGNFFLEDGWRKNSPSRVNQLFTKASFRGEKVDLNFSTLLVQTDLVGNGLVPSQMYEQSRSDVFTAPDTTKNRLAQFQLSGSYFVDDSFTITGQVYRRNSKRSQKGSDVFTDYKEALLARRRPNAGEEYTCIFRSSNGLGIPDYYVIPVNETAGQSLSDVNLLGGTSAGFANDYASNGFVTADYDAYKNTSLNNEYANNYASLIKLNHDFYRNKVESIIYVQDGTTPPTGGPDITDTFGNQTPSYTTGAAVFNASGFAPLFGGTDNILYREDTYFYQTASNGDLIKNYVIFTAPINTDACTAARLADGVQDQPYSQVDANNNPIYVDGASGGIDPATGLGFPGVVEGTPTGIVNNNQIDQVVDGASFQFNWNFEKHKFMVGMSIDVANADYSNTSQLGFLDANRNVYLDPAQAAPQFIGAMQPIENNNFEGTQTTQSIYFSETWSPVDTLHITTSARYNQTTTKNKIAARYGLGSIAIGDLDGVPDQYNTCDGDCQTNRPLANYRESRFLANPLDPAETEKFSFYSFNPSLGFSWQAKESLSLFANWSQGTRVPSVVELGCAFDDTPTPSTTGVIGPKSVVENRQCTLPTTLAGDPFLPQIKATTYDIGLRGTFDSTFQFDSLNWNVGVFQTDLKDDIYFVAAGNGTGFFQTINKTRRRGFEAGLSGKKDKWGFTLNYSLTDATFEDNFRMLSIDNSSSFVEPGFGNVIDVKQGSRMPGVALHNMNASLNYEITPAWQVGLSSVVHSGSFLRGNENNEHRVGVIQDRGLGASGNALVRPTSNPGKVDGYATFNFQTSYKISKEWTASMLINNIFDKEYFTAGRLGRNPFSPSISGAIGPDGYNHNSNDWLSTNFIAPGAPRGVWFSLNWHFVPD